MIAIGMVLQKLGRKVSFGTGGNYSGWHQDVLRTLPLIFGVAALATTLLLGSFLWRFVARRKKKAKDTSITVSNFSLHAGHKPNTIASIFPDVPRVPASFPSQVVGFDNDAYSDESESDEEEEDCDDCDEVLAEAAGAHADATPAESGYNTPARKASIESWLARSPDIRRHNFEHLDLDDVESVFAMRQGDIFRRQEKPSKSWKKLFFWRRSKTTNQFQFSKTGAIHSSCGTPLHHMFQPSRTRATVAPATTLFPSQRDFMPKRPTSGPIYPIYYDGVPQTPTRNSRPFTSPRSACATPTRDGLYESTGYLPLKRPYSTYRSCPSPLYIP